jgi:hypothetical protein
MSLIKIQQELKAPKNQFNAFAKYKYRSAEDIIEAAKPICHKYGYALMLSDEVIEVGGRVYVKATAHLFKNEDGDSARCCGIAREDEFQKGMSASQITGAASSYARKYALNGLFAIDDTKDADATNEHKDEVSEGQKAFLIEALDKTKFTQEQKYKAIEKIKAIKSLEEYNKIKETIKKS